MTNWYLLPGNTAIGFVLVILRSSIVVKITAGKMIDLSLSTFGIVSIQKCILLIYRHVELTEIQHFKIIYNYITCKDNYTIIL